VPPPAFTQVIAQLNLTKRNTVSSYFRSKLDKTQTKTGGVISLNDSGGIAQNIILYAVAGYKL
jgi:hypothetical protein